MNEQTFFDAGSSEIDAHSHFASEPTGALASARDLDAQLVAACRVERGAQHRLAILLAEMADSGLFRVLGYTSIEKYAEIVLDIGFRVARDLLRIGRSLSELPALNAALASGDVGYSKAREIVRVATTETDALWTAHAKLASTREIERDVSVARRGELPPSGKSAPHRRPARSRVTFEMEAADREILVRALALLRQQTGVSASEVEDGVLLAGLARQFVQQVEPVPSATDASFGSPSGAPPKSAGGERYTFVIRHCPSCDEVCGAVAEVSDSIRAEAACDAEIIDMRPGPAHGNATRAIAPKLRRSVLHRAGEHCEVPGCTNHLWLDIHHVDGWAQTKLHAPDRLLVVCSAHHRAIHEGNLSVDIGLDLAVFVEHADGRRNEGPARPSLVLRSTPRGGPA